MSDKPSVSRSDALERRHPSGVTWLEIAKEWAEETIESGPSAYIDPKASEALAQVTLALIAEREEANGAASYFVRDEPNITPRRALIRQAAEIERLKAGRSENSHTNAAPQVPAKATSGAGEGNAEADRRAEADIGTASLVTGGRRDAAVTTPVCDERQSTERVPACGAASSVGFDKNSALTAEQAFNKIIDLVEDIKLDRYGYPLKAALHLCNDLADENHGLKRQLETARSATRRRVRFSYVGEVTAGQRDSAWKSGIADIGDARLAWVNEGDIIELGEEIERSRAEGRTEEKP